MDLSGKYSDLFNDEGLIEVLNELDEECLNPQKGPSDKEQSLPQINQSLKTQTYSINSTRYDSDASSVVLSEEFDNKYTKHWRSYQRKFDLHISKILTPLVRHILETSITIGGRSVYFTKKKTYLEYLINETVSVYKQQWKEVYIPLCYSSQERPSDPPVHTSVNLDQAVTNGSDTLTRQLSSLDMNSLARTASFGSVNESECDFTQEDLMSEVFVEGSCRHELVDLLYRNGMNYFYHLMEFLLVALERTSYSHKIVQVLDLLTTIIRVMPELSILLVVPRNKDSKILYEKRCYFKLLVGCVRERLGLKPDSVLDVYKGFLRGTFVPFYMDNPYKLEELVDPDLDNELMLVDREPANGCRDVTSLTLVYVMDRLLNLAKLITESTLEFLQLNLSEPTRAGLSKKMKKYLLIPLLGLRPLHELFPPFSGNFEFDEVRGLDYGTLIKKYFYTPPPLCSLRLRFMGLLELISNARLVEYRGNFAKANRRLVDSEPVAGMNLKVDKVIVNYFHLLTFGASFLLMGEFMKRSVDSPGAFFGNYLFLLPHFRINMARVNLDTVVEENVYRLQKGVIGLLGSLEESRIFTGCNFMGVKSLKLVQGNVVKRLLSLLIHYVTNTSEPELEDAARGFNLENEFNISNRFQINCSRYCDTVVPYNVNSILGFLSNPVSKAGYGDHEELLKYNDDVKLGSMTVDVSSFEEFEKIAKHGLNPSNYYIPLENRKDIKFAVEPEPLLKFKTSQYAKELGTTMTRTSTVDTKSYILVEEGNLFPSVGTDRTVQFEGKSCEFGGTTVRDGPEPPMRVNCGLVCLLAKHMVEESRFKRVFELRKDLVVRLLTILSSYPPECLGDLEPVYISFVKKLVS